MSTNEEPPFDRPDTDTLQRAYDDAGGNIERAAQWFDANQSTVWNWMVKAGIHEPLSWDSYPEYPPESERNAPLADRVGDAIEILGNATWDELTAAFSADSDDLVGAILDLQDRGQIKHNPRTGCYEHRE